MNSTGRNTSGFVGRTEDSPVILRCSVSGIINSTQSFTGGFVGRHNNGFIKDAYAYADVLGDGSCVGGFAGYVASSARIATALCSGSVASEDSYVGAFVGQAGANGLVTNSYYNNFEDNGMLAAGTEDNGPTYYTGITSLSNNEMQQQDKFQGFDFDATWTIIKGMEHPIFRYSVQHVTFDPAGGTCAIESYDYVIGDCYDQRQEMPEPVRPGYNFLGWFDDNGIQVFANSYVTIDANRILHARWTVTPWSGSGAEDDPYIIEYPSQLDLLAERVNSGTGNDDASSGYKDNHFQLANDITYDYTGLDETESNYTTIGGEGEPFKGHFDGQNHVVSGIRINSMNNYQGLFGEIGSGAEVKCVILTDARITGNTCTGGIAGRNNGGTISGCFVENDVTIGSLSNATCHGGIVGNIINNGLISGCASKATINGITGNHENENFGGVAGQNNSSTIENSLYLGSSITGRQDIGAIVGYNSTGSTVRNCYYTASNFVGKNGSGTEFTFNPAYNNDPAIGSNSGTTENVRLAPQDNQDNTAFLALMAARNAALTAVERATPISTAVDVTLSGRTLWKDGCWNTLCLPFNLTISGSILDGDNVDVRTLSSSEFSNGVLTLNFTPAAPAVGAVTQLVAGTPYVIKWATKEAPAANLVSPTFTGVTVGNATANAGTTYADFIGTYSSMPLTINDKSILFLGDNNTLYWPNAANYDNGTPDDDTDDYYRLKAFRGYFQLNGLVMDDDIVNARMFVGDDETTSLIEKLRVKSEECAPAQWYTLDGRKLNGMPTQKGVYINNNRKLGL